MLGAVLLFGVLAGVDNLQVCSSVGLLPLGRRRHLLAVGFSLCEMAAPLVGLAMGHLLLGSLGGAAAKAGPLLMLMCGAGLIACHLLEHTQMFAPCDNLVGRTPSSAQDPLVRLFVGPSRPTRGSAADQGVRPTGQASGPLSLLFGLPLSLSLDNLLGGAGISALGYPMVPAALLIGLVSAVMSCAGLYVGGSARGFALWRGARSAWLSRCLEPAVGAYLCLLAVRLLIVSGS
jgi:putative Mn2+ efflux pump MntP